MEQANRDTKKPRGRKTGGFKNNRIRGGTKTEKATSPSWTGNTSSVDYTKKGRRI
ncbi:hypothetical protein M433DRAFT_156294, partial [Acidomyces richmondensis BFW]